MHLYQDLGKCVSSLFASLKSTGFESIVGTQVFIVCKLQISDGVQRLEQLSTGLR